MTKLAKTALVLTLGLGGASEAAAGEELVPPRVQLALSAGGGIFRGGAPAGTVASAIPFQADVSSATVAGTVSFRLTRRVFLDIDVAAALSRTRDGIETPDNVFLSGGLRFPFSLSGGRLVPYVAVGGGVVNRQPQDGVARAIEDAFDVSQTDPQAHAGAGVDVRVTKAFGLRADYRYVRIFPDDLKDLDVERGGYGAHRVTGGVTLSF